MTRSAAIERFLTTVEGLGQEWGEGVEQTIRTALLALARFGKRELGLLALAKEAERANVLGVAYPLPVMIGATERQIANDVEILMRALQQRQIASGTQVRAALRQADGLVRRALSALILTDNAREVAPVTYLGKIHDVQQVPYAPLLLVGIPMWAVIDPLLLTAVAHESGHYYHSELARTLAGVPAQPSAAWPPEFDKWQEEIFADIVSILLAGPAAAISMLMIARRSDPASLVEDDGVHPPPLLRLRVAIAVLRAIAVQETQDDVPVANLIEQALVPLYAAADSAVAAQTAVQNPPVPAPSVKWRSLEDGLTLYTGSWLTTDELDKFVRQYQDGTHDRWTSGAAINAGANEDEMITALRSEMEAAAKRGTGWSSIGLAPMSDSTGEITKIVLTNLRQEDPPQRDLASGGGSEAELAGWSPAIFAGGWDADEGGTLISGRP
jgi:hypothetical protein